jgi:hypothetical protein
MFDSSEPEHLRSKIGTFLWVPYYTSSHPTVSHALILYRQEEFLKGKLALEHALGLGAKPNVIPPGEARIDADLRTVEIGWHPVAGMGGKWLAEKSGLGKSITKHIGKYPDPTQHWAVLVGEYIHELWMDEHLDVIYINEKLDRAQWHTFEVGKTRFTDEALRQAG